MSEIFLEINERKKFELLSLQRIIEESWFDQSFEIEDGEIDPDLTDEQMMGVYAWAYLDTLIKTKQMADSDFNILPITTQSSTRLNEIRSSVLVDIVIAARDGRELEKLKMKYQR